jgi:hypothetical protein
MSDPVRLCDAIAALLPALRPAPIPGAGHRPVSRAVICCASGEAGGPPTAAQSPAAASGPALLAPVRPGFRSSWAAPSFRSSGQAPGGGPG